MIYVLHRIRDDLMAGFVADESVHLLGDSSIPGVARCLTPQLQEVERLPGVHVDVVANPVCERNGVLGDVRRVSRGDPVGEGRRPFHHIVPRRCRSDVGDRFGCDVPVIRCEALPLDGEHPVSLQVTEDAVIG